MIDELPSGLIGMRDRALITLGFAGAFRRSELVALNCGDLTFVSEGLEALVFVPAAVALWMALLPYWKLRRMRDAEHAALPTDVCLA